MNPQFKQVKDIFLAALDKEGTAENLNVLVCKLKKSAILRILGGQVQNGSNTFLFNFFCFSRTQGTSDENPWNHFVVKGTAAAIIKKGKKGSQ